jgi:competence protein ComEC
MFKILLFLISISNASELIVWNVGQGLWVTEVHSDFCLHFDMGGEKDPSQKVLKFCRDKVNYVHLSHWDWDHISFAKKYSRLVKTTCLINWPQGPHSTGKDEMLKQIKLCSKVQLKNTENSTQILHRSRNLKDSNSASEVIWSQSFHLLVPGDSPSSQEKIWKFQVPQTTKGLILGHHGSRTSTSQVLLSNLPNLRWAIASARKSRYGHPHLQTVKRLEEQKVPLLKTEDWGNLHFLN